MGIYSNGDTFGIRIYHINEDDDFIRLFDETYSEVMTCEQKRHAYVFYTKVENKDKIKVQVYTECSSTYRKGKFMMWLPISTNQFLQEFSEVFAFETNN